MKKETKLLTITTVGFALFSMFFGAGNLVVPPYIGLQVGSQWVYALFGFLLTTVITSFLAVIMIARVGTSFADLKQFMPKWVVDTLNLLIIISIGPLICIPRTGALTYEVAVAPILPQVPLWVFELFYFVLVLVLSISKSKIVDIIGRWLTPLLLLCLAILIVKGVLNAEAIDQQSAVSAGDAFRLGFKEGYQTLDVLAAIPFAGLIIVALTMKGYTTDRQRIEMSLKSGLVAAVSLMLIYTGLMYLGVTTDYAGGGEVERSQLLKYISDAILGSWGSLVMASAIGFACLTSAIALASGMGEILEQTTKGKMSYKLGVVACCVVSFVLSLNKVDTIIAYAGSILLFIYPIVFTIILYVLLFSKYVKSKLPYVMAVLTTAVVVTWTAIYNQWDVFQGIYWMTAVKSAMPLMDYLLEWLVPSFLAFVFFAFTEKYWVKWFSKSNRE